MSFSAEDVPNLVSDCFSGLETAGVWLTTTVVVTFLGLTKASRGHFGNAAFADSSSLIIANEVILGKLNCQFADDYVVGEAKQQEHLHQSRQSEPCRSSNLPVCSTC
jgi:hypothetical protein